MIYRTVAILIVIFWIAMTGLLLRKELAPGATALLEVPVSHVAKLLFVHQQTSSLYIASDRQRVGQLQIHPQVRKEDGARILECSGYFQVAIPGLSHQRVSWNGDFEMDRAFELQLAKFTLSFRDPTSYAVDVIVEPRARKLRYITRAGDRQLDQGEYALDEQGALTWLGEQGIDPTLIKRFHQPNGPQPTLRAWQSSMDVRGHRLDVFRVAFEHGGQTLLEFYVDQIGYIPKATTFLGYTAAQDEGSP